MDKYGVVFLCAIFAFVIFITYLLLNYKKPAEAKAEPITTEVPEYVMRATKCGMYSCTEYTIYRITRN